MPDPSNAPGSLEEKIKRLLQDSSVRELTPLQIAFTKLTWSLWLLPSAPPISASPDEISHYRELEISSERDADQIILPARGLMAYPAA